MRLVKRIVIGYVAFVVSTLVAAVAVRRMVPEFGTESDDVVSLVASMAGREFRSSAAALRSIAALAFMGGIEIDLRNADIVDGATLDLRAIMGGIDVIVPEGWRVETATSAFLGGVGSRVNPDAVGDDAPLLLVEASAMLGGIEIHVDGDA